MSTRATATRSGGPQAARQDAARIRPAGPPMLSALGNRGVQRALSGVTWNGDRPESTGSRPALPVNAPGDRFEIEADRVAQQVMAPPAPGLQRKCECGGSCPKCSHQEDENVQRQATSAIGPAVAPGIVHDVIGSSGSPLDAATRTFFESRFGRSFGSVRVHTDGQAAASASAVGATAYTVGSHIAFGAGRYEPHTDAGRRLLAHELSHVVQQGGMALAPTVQRDQTTPKGCPKHREGEGTPIDPPAPDNQGDLLAYLIWGTVQPGESYESLRRHAVKAWLDRYPGMTPAQKAHNLEVLTKLRWVSPPNRPADGCSLPVVLTLEVYKSLQLPDSKTSAAQGDPKKPAAPPTPPRQEQKTPTDAKKPGGNLGDEQGKKGEDTGEKATENWKALADNEPLARAFLKQMNHFGGLVVTSEMNAAAAGGLTEQELKEILDKNQSIRPYALLFTQSWTEFKAAGGTDLDAFKVLVERILEQFNWGNPTATKNLLKIGKGGGPLAEDRKVLGILHRRRDELLYDQNAAPLPIVGGGRSRDEGFVGAKPPSWGLNIANVKDPALFGVLNSLRMNVGDPNRMVAQAAQVLYENIELVKPRVLAGLAQEVIKKFEDMLPMFIGFLAGQGLAHLLTMSGNPHLMAVGAALKGLLTLVGYVLEIDFALSAIERLLASARFLARVSRDEKGALTQLSYDYLDRAAVPLRDMVADLVMLATMSAFGRLLGRLGKGKGKEQIGGEKPRIECHSCTIEPAKGEPTAAGKAEAKAEPKGEAKEAKAEGKPEAKAEGKPAAKAEGRPEATPEATPEAKPEGKKNSRKKEAEPDPVEVDRERGRQRRRAFEHQMKTEEGFIDAAEADKVSIAKRLRELRDLQAKEPNANVKERAERASEIKEQEQELADLDGEIRQREQKLKKVEQDIEASSLTLFDKLSALSRRQPNYQRVKRTARVDAVSGKPALSPQPDHLVPIRELATMKEFRDLPLDKQKLIMDMPENLVPMEGGPNMSKGDRSWSEWPQAENYYDLAQKNRMIKEEARVRGILVAKMIEFAKGVPALVGH